MPVPVLLTNFPTADAGIDNKEIPTADTGKLIDDKVYLLLTIIDVDEELLCC